MVSISAVEAIRDPFLDITLQEMGIEVHAESRRLLLHAGFPVLPLQKNLAHVIAAELNHPIDIDFAYFIKAHLTQLPGKGLRGVKNTIAVASGKGGVGKSTVAVHLACALAKAGARVGLLDADIYGPSIPLMLGEHAPLVIDNNRYVPVRAHGVQAMSIGYLHSQEGALIWRGPMLAKSLIHMLDNTAWDSLDYLFIDLPPGTGDIPLTLVQKIPLSGAIVVTTPQQVATLDAEKALHMFKKTHIPILGLVENMAAHTCSNCGHVEAIFGREGARRLAQQFDVPLLGQIPLNLTIQAACDAGMPSTTSSDKQLEDTWMKIALTMAITLAKRPSNHGLSVRTETKDT